jgi:hypothetical protein
VTAAAVDWIAIAGEVAPWHRLGLLTARTDEDGCEQFPLFGTGIEIDTTGRPGGRRLVMSGVDPELTHLDGITVEVRPPHPPLFASHPLGAHTIDHVVIATDSLARTSDALAAATGAELRRVREAGEIRQGFHRLGGLILEIVERAGLPSGPANVWGMALVVDELDTACARLGDELVGEPRDAVQPGRRIATVRPAAGLAIPVALMTPDRR